MVNKTQPATRGGDTLGGLRDGSEPISLAPPTTMGTGRAGPTSNFFNTSRHPRSCPLNLWWTPHRCPFPIAEPHPITPNGESDLPRRLTKRAIVGAA